MAAVSVKTNPDVGRKTLSGTANKTSRFNCYTSGVLRVYSTSAFEVGFDSTVADDTAVSADTGWLVPASQGYDIYIAKIPTGGLQAVNIWSATASAIIIWNMTAEKR